MTFDFSIVAEYMPLFLKGTLYTIGISVVGILLGSVLGLVISLFTSSDRRLLRWPFVAYINFFRGTPILVQLFLIHFGIIPLVIAQGSAIPKELVSVILTLSLNSAAYMAEIFRAGIEGVDRGQMEAARSLGMTKAQAMRYVILPQAIKRMIPPMGNEFIVLLKESSLGAIIAAPELMYWGRAAAGQYYKVWEPYLTVAVIYLLLTLTLTWVLQLIEKKVKIND